MKVSLWIKFKMIEKCISLYIYHTKVDQNESCIDKKEKCRVRLNLHIHIFED